MQRWYSQSTTSCCTEMLFSLSREGTGYEGTSLWTKRHYLCWVTKFNKQERCCVQTECEAESNWEWTQSASWLCIEKRELLSTLAAMNIWIVVDENCKATPPNIMIEPTISVRRRPRLSDANGVIGRPYRKMSPGNYRAWNHTINPPMFCAQLTSPV